MTLFRPKLRAKTSATQDSNIPVIVRGQSGAAIWPARV